MALFIRKLTNLPAGVTELANAAHAEGFFMLDRLIEKYLSDKNKFDRSGEALFGAIQSEKLVGIGGLNIDPYFANSHFGRLRHLYVHPSARRRGVGRKIVEAIETFSAGRFERLQLYTPEESASEFYEALGYARVSGIEKVSHAKMLTP